jgi:hypothetical protein
LRSSLLRNFQPVLQFFLAEIALDQPVHPFFNADRNIVSVAEAPKSDMPHSLRKSLLEKSAVFIFSSSIKIACKIDNIIRVFSIF